MTISLLLGCELHNLFERPVNVKSTHYVSVSFRKNISQYSPNTGLSAGDALVVMLERKHCLYWYMVQRQVDLQCRKSNIMHDILLTILPDKWMDGMQCVCRYGH